jgi:CubicO group peptidase (beta-lactamase class C family)
MTPETVNLWLSAGKPLTAVAVLKLWDQSRLDLDECVVKFLPEFGVGGKDRITIRHLLTHTCGFRLIETGWPDSKWDEIIRNICAATVEPDWIIGRTAGYHTSSSWFILGEILARLTGDSYVDAMRHQLFEPLGLTDTWAALTPEQHSAYGTRLGRIFARERGELQLLDWHEPERCANPSPGSNTRGPIRELGHFYEMLLSRGVAKKARILSVPAVEALTARHRVGLFDQTLAHIVDFGLGVIVDSNLYGANTVPYGYGRYCSPRTFGHGGAQSSQGWCDPEQKLVVAYYFNGRPGEGQHNRRARHLNEAIYTDLGLI